MSGTVTISLEIELAWGVVRSHPEKIDERFSAGRRRETETLDRLLTLCDDLDIPVSFDVVGHLLLESCSGRHDGPHPDGAFESDPGSDRETAPLFYAPDLVERIREASTEHEICTHTFSHVRCDQVSPTVVDWELEAVKQLHAEHGLAPPRSFVPPVHAPPPRDVLLNHDIRTVRAPVELHPPVREPDRPRNGVQGTFERLRRSHPAQVFFRTPTVEEPALVDGLVETYTSWHTSLSAPYLPKGQASPHPLYRAIPRSIRRRHHRRFLARGLREAAARESSVHYWSHLFDISNGVQWSAVRSFLDSLATARNRGRVQIETMDALGERIG